MRSVDLKIIIASTLVPVLIILSAIIFYITLQQFKIDTLTKAVLRNEENLTMLTDIIIKDQDNGLKQLEIIERTILALEYDKINNRTIKQSRNIYMQCLKKVSSKDRP